MSVEQLLKSAKALNAEQICLEAGKTALILVGGNVKELTKTQLTPYDIFKLISPIMPEDKKVALVGQPTTEFIYNVDGVGTFHIFILKQTNGIKVLFKDITNSGDSANLPPTQAFMATPAMAQPVMATPVQALPNQPVPTARPVMAQPAAPLGQPDTIPLPVGKPLTGQPASAQASAQQGVIPLPVARPPQPAPVTPPQPTQDATVPLDEQQRQALAEGRPPEPRQVPPAPVPKAMPFNAVANQVAPGTVPPPIAPLAAPSAASNFSTTGTMSGTMMRTMTGITPDRQRFRQEVDKLLERTLKMRGSDLHIATGAPPIVRRFGTLMRVEGEILEVEKARSLIKEILTDEQFNKFEKTGDLDFSYEVIGVGRFRGNVLRQNRGIDLTFHAVPSEILPPEALGLPSLVRDLTRFHQGLILITGAAGQGKSTTISSLVDVINSERALHILTVEDPIEFVHPVDKKAIVNQREVGRHTKSFANALRAALREDPDVIVVGEMRDLETISLAVTASETGHLVMGTLMTSSAHQTVDRVLDSFPPGQQNQIRAMLSDSLRAVISQRLLPMVDESGMVLAAEIMLGTTAIANLIREKKTFQIPSVIQTNRHIGMKRMDDALLELVQAGKVHPQKALDFASDKKGFEAAIKRI
jgi:twitching motility protein PilT